MKAGAVLFWGRRPRWLLVVLGAGDQGSDLVADVAVAEDEGGLGASQDVLEHFHFLEAREDRVFGEQPVVLAWLRAAAVSSRRRMRLASASLVAAMTWLSSVFMSPGRTMSR